MRRLNTEAEVAEARCVARRVFRSIGLQFTEPFCELMEARMLIHPIDYTMLSETQFATVAQAAASIGESEAFVVPYGSLEEGWDGTYDHRLIAIDDYDDYRPDGELVLEHLLYSPNGRWGVKTSHGDFAVVGGERGFVEAVDQAIPDANRSMARGFAADWLDIRRHGSSVDWLEPLLAHIYGQEGAATLIKEASA